MTSEEAVHQFQTLAPYLGRKYTVADAAKAMSRFCEAINKPPKQLTVRDLTRLALFIDQWKVD